MHSFKLIFICFVCFSPTIDANSSTENESKRMIGVPGKIYEVLILGAGIAGITAAKTLHKAGITNFLVLEASKDHVGGRLLKKDIFPKHGGGVVELGANWVHGPDCNPIWDLVQEAKLVGVDTMIKPNEEGEGKYIVLNENGEDITKFVDHKHWKEKQTCLEEGLERRASDISMRDALRKCEWNLKPKIVDINTEKRFLANQAIEYFWNDFDAAVAPEKISCGVRLRSDGAIDSEDDRQFIISDRRGYETIVLNMAQKFPEKILRNHLVKKITSGKDVVQVEVEGKGFFQAKFVLVTFSIGVLQQSHTSMFPEPLLPPPFVASLNMMQMGNYLKIFLKFEKRFWYPQYDYIFYATKTRGYYPVWQNLPGTPTNIPENDNILLVTVTGEEANRFKNVEEGTKIIEQELLPILDKVTKPVQNVPIKLIGIEFKNWGFDPLFWGAYSNPKVYTTRAHFDTLTQPVGNGKIFFAGEGTSQLYYGFAHGAYLTGQDQAEKIIIKSELLLLASLPVVNPNDMDESVNRISLKNSASGWNYMLRESIGKSGNNTKL